MTAEAVYISSLMVGLSFMIVGISVFALTLRHIVRTRSHWYRKFVTNIYVAGKVRQYAEKDNVDLDKEYLEFLKYDNLDDTKRRKELDNEIEEKLMKEINPEEEFNSKKGKK